MSDNMGEGARWEDERDTVHGQTDASESKGWKVSVLLPVEQFRRLAVLADDPSDPAAVAVVLAVLADHAQQGVYRPGAWERGWLMQVFGDEWLTRVEPDLDDVSADGRVIFDRPRLPS